MRERKRLEAMLADDAELARRSGADMKQESEAAKAP